MYLVLAKSNNYMQGVFPHTEEGRRLAEEFVEKSTKKTKEQFYITEK